MSMSLMDRRLSEAQARPAHMLHERAERFLHDYSNPNPERLNFARSMLGAASIGAEVEGQYYRITDTYKVDGQAEGSQGYRYHLVRGLIAVEQVLDEAVLEKNGVKMADDYAGKRLWRLTPARVQYAIAGFDDVVGPDIEDLAKTGLEISRTTDTFGRSTDSVPYISSRNFANALEGDEAARAIHVVGMLLDRIGA